MADKKVEKVIVLGSGPAGLTAALYTSRAMLEPLVLSGMEPGGQLTTTTEVDNYPGFPGGIQGPELMMNMQKQVESFGTRIVPQEVTEVDFSQKPFLIKTGSDEYYAHSVVIATGASARWLGIPSEQEYRGKGVSACGTCDAFFFKDKVVYTVGGGNTALEEALFLTRFAKKVVMLHRRDEFRGEKILHEKVLSHEKIEVIWNSEVVEVLGDGTKVTGVKVKNRKTEEIKDHNTDGFFVFIGHAPNTKIFESQIKTDEKGYIDSIEDVKTNVPGVFVAGDVADFKYQQAITAAGMGCKAALEVAEYLQE